MKKLFIIILVLIFIFLIIFFFPESSGSGGSCVDCVNTYCECFGFEKTTTHLGPWSSTCYGKVYNCRSEIFNAS